MTIHAGPYIQRRILHQLYWAKQFRADAEAMELKVAERRAAALECERKAMELAAGTDFTPPSNLQPQR